MTVMDRLVAELGGIETAIVTLQEQVCLSWVIFIATSIIPSVTTRSLEVSTVDGCHSLVKMNDLMTIFDPFVEDYSNS